MSTFLLVILGIVILHFSRSILLGIFRIILTFLKLPLEREYQLSGLLISFSLVIGGNYIFS